MAVNCCLKSGVDEIDEVAHVLVLPPTAALVHGVAERDSRIGIREAQRPAGAEVPERARARAETPLGLRELEPESEARGALQHRVLAVHLLVDRLRDDRRREDATAI